LVVVGQGEGIQVVVYGRDLRALSIGHVDQLLEHAVPLLELLLIAATELKLLSSNIPDNMKDMSSGNRDGEDRLDVVDVDPTVQMKSRLRFRTTGQWLGRFLAADDALAANKDLLEQVDLESLVGRASGVEERVMEKQGAKIRDELTVLPGNLVLQGASNDHVVLATVGLVDLLGNALDGIQTLNQIPVEGMLGIRQLDELVHQQRVSADALDGLDQVRVDAVLGFNQVVHFLWETRGYNR
jgi:hypothetical protein